MTVAVERELITLATYLKDRGYNVVTLGEYNYPIDAVIYSNGKMPPAIYDYNYHGMTNQVKQNGILMINATNRDMGEIENVLKNRIYSPLF